MRRIEPAQIKPKYPTNNGRMDAATRAMNSALRASNAYGSPLTVKINSTGEIRVVNIDGKGLGESGIKKIMGDNLIREGLYKKRDAQWQKEVNQRYNDFLESAAEYHDAASAPVIKPTPKKTVDDYEFELFQKMNDVKPTPENLQKSINDARLELAAELKRAAQNKEYIQALRNHIDGLEFEKGIHQVMGAATPAQKASMDAVLKPAKDAFEALRNLKMQRSALQGNADFISGHIKKGTYSEAELKDVSSILRSTNERIQELDQEIKSIEDYTKQEPANVR